MGGLVKYGEKVLVIGGDQTAMVEELNGSELLRDKNPMSPVNGYTALYLFTTLSIDRSLLIFGRSLLKKKVDKNIFRGNYQKERR